MSTDIEVSQATTDPAAFLKSKITNPVLAFKSDEDVAELVGAIRQMATEQAAGIDVSTSTGRKSLVSVAAKVAKSRAFLKEVSTQAVRTLKAEVDAVKIRGEKALEDLDELRDEIRQPVTEWEQAEDARIKAHNDALTQIRSIATQAMTRYASDDEINCALNDLNAIAGRNWDEFTEQANDLLMQATDALGAARNLLEQRAKEKAEREDTARRLAEEQAAKAEAERKLADAQKAAQDAQKNADALQEVEGLYDLMARSGDMSIDDLRKEITVISLAVTGIQVLDRARSAALRTLKSTLEMKEREAAKKAPLPGQDVFPWEQGDTIVQPEKMPEPPMTIDEVREIVNPPAPAIPVKLSDRDVVLSLIHAATAVANDLRLRYECEMDGESCILLSSLEDAIKAAEERFKA